MGLMKSIICDRLFAGRFVPSNVQFKGGINPPREERGAQYNVNRLPESLRSLCIPIVSIDDSDSIDLDNYILQMLYIKRRKNPDNFRSVSESSLYCLQKLLSVAHRSCQRRGAQSTDSNYIVSQREIGRTFVFFEFLVRGYREYLQQNDQRIAQAIGFNYMLRLAESERKVLCDELLPFIQNFTDNSFQGSIREFIADWINEVNFKLGSGVALTEALRENMMADLLAFMICTAASIVGKPGTSKTLSVRTLRTISKASCQKLLSVERCFKSFCFPFLDRFQ